MLTELEQKIIASIQEDMAITSRPYLKIAEDLGISESELLKNLKDLCDRGVIRRFGATLRHQRTGFTANAMVVWNIPSKTIKTFTEHTVTYDAISHCYERLKTPVWPYNIYTMIHGKTRNDTEQIIADLAAHCEGTPQYEALYTVKEYKKQRVDYFSETFYEWDKQQNEDI